MFKQSLNAKQVAITAVMTAVVFVLTRTIQIPTPAKGYIHLGDAAIFFAAFAFDPWVAGIVGGLGTALADISSGPFAIWAPFSFVIHGLQGWVVARIVGHAGPLQRRRTEWYRIILGVCAGSAIVVIGYFFAGLILGQAAAVSEIPANILQALSGGVIGAPLYLAVRAAYPPLTQR